jgi:hypothetical protein
MACRLYVGGKRPLLALLCTAVLLWASAPRAEAQVSSQQRKSAAEAYDRGTSAWLAGQYSQAAQWFETAHRLAPSPAALVQAIRSHAESGNSLRAASLSLWLKAEYDADPRANKVADGILEEAEDNYGKVVVTCDDDCTVNVGGKVHEYLQFFVEPGMEHTITAGFQYGDVDQKVKVGHGDTAELSFEAPPAPPEDERAVAEGGAPEVEKEPWHGLPRWVTITAMAVTLGLGAGALVSGIDTNRAASSYEDWAAAGRQQTSMHPDATGTTDDGWGVDGNDQRICTVDGTDFCAEVQGRYDDGKKLQRRTNILIGTAAGMAAVSAVLAIFLTDWKNKAKKDDLDDDEGGVEITGGFGWQPGGGMAMLEGRF